MTWRERIQAARERGGFTQDDVWAADHWGTCAVGEQRAAMPLVVQYKWITDNYEVPKDRALRRLGSVRSGIFGWGKGFAAAVRDNDFARAEDLLDAIEDRALQLKREASAPAADREGTR